MTAKEKLLYDIHVEYLSKAETAKIDGTELTVLPYGYLQQACEEAINQYTRHIIDEAVGEERELRQAPLYENKIAHSVIDSILTRIKELTQEK